MIRKIRIATILETEQSIIDVTIPENKSLVYIKDNILNVKHDESNTWNAYNSIKEKLSNTYINKNNVVLEED